MTPNRDFFAGLSLASLIVPAVLAANNTDAAVSVEGFQGATLDIAIGVGGINFTGTNKIELVLTHSDDGVTYVPVSDYDVIKDALAPATITNGIVRSLTAAKAAADVQKLGYIGGKAYLQLVANFSGTHATGTPIAATVVLGMPALQGAA